MDDQRPDLEASPDAARDVPAESAPAPPADEQAADDAARDVPAESAPAPPAAGDAADDDAGTAPGVDESAPAPQTDMAPPEEQADAAPGADESAPAPHTDIAAAREDDEGEAAGEGGREAVPPSGADVDPADVAEADSGAPSDLTEADEQAVTEAARPAEPPAEELSGDAGQATESSEVAEAEAATTPVDTTPDETDTAADESGAELEAAAEGERGRPSDPRGAITEAEDPEAAARAALGLSEERQEQQDELRPEDAAAILAAAAQPEEPEEEQEEDVEVDLEDADLLEVYEEEAAEPSPYDRAGGWYVVHTYSGYEKKVKSNLESRVKSLHLEGQVHEVVIPMDDVMEFKGGKKTVVQKKVFPGYLLVRMDMGDDTWQAVRNTPGVTGFVGGGAKPTPLSRKEVESILRVRPEDEAKKARPRLEFEVGDQVRVTAGPFADFNGLIDEINVDQSTLKVLVNIFGRETPVTLDFADVAKL